MNRICLILLLGLILFYPAHAQDKASVKQDTIKVDIWSDVICPYCYMGKRRFENALKAFEHKDNVVIVWHSYQLNPEAPKEYKGDMYDVMAERFGQPRQWIIEQIKPLQDEAASVGLTYNYDSMKPTNTFDAHRLIQLAATHNVQDKAEEALFRAYFTEGKNINDAATLIQIGTSIGLNEQEIKDMLQSNAFADKVLADEKASDDLKISGVPYFIFNGKYKIDGAQPPQTFLKTLEKAWGKSK